MSMPYKVLVTGKKNDMGVVVRPQPIATEEEYIKVVAGRFQRALMNPNIKNTLLGRAKLKKELEEILKDFHDQGLIRPKEEKEDEKKA